MEMREVFTRDGKPLNRIIPKHAPMERGWYLLHAIVILYTPEGQYIMQQRSLKARYYPGKWDVTGGGVNAGETPAQAAARETWEELGIKVDADSLIPMLREVTDWENGTGLITHTLAGMVEIPPEGLCIDPREVNDVKCVDFQTFYDTVLYNKTDAFAEMLRRVEAMRKKNA